MVDDIEKKNQRFYDIDKEMWMDDLTNTHKKLTKELMDYDEVFFDPKPKQTVTILYDTKIKKK